MIRVTRRLTNTATQWVEDRTDGKAAQFNGFVVAHCREYQRTLPVIAALIQSVGLYHGLPEDDDVQKRVNEFIEVFLGLFGLILNTAFIIAIARKSSIQIT